MFNKLVNNFNKIGDASLHISLSIFWYSKVRRYWENLVERWFVLSYQHPAVNYIKYSSSFRRGTRRPSAILWRRLRYAVDRFLIITSVRRPTTALFILFRPALEGNGRLLSARYSFSSLRILPHLATARLLHFMLSLCCVLLRKLYLTSQQINLAPIGQTVFAPIPAPSS